MLLQRWYGDGVKRKTDWSFWRDDVPNLVWLVMAVVCVGIAKWLVSLISG